MKKAFAAALIVAMVLGMSTMAYADKQQDKRDKINAMSKETLNKLFEKSPSAKKLHDKAYGYAVFDNIKLSLMISGGGGHGVAVNKKAGKRTYMKMGTAGLNIGLGGQKYQIVFLFQTEKRFKDFVEKGWEADANANAVAGKKGANAEATFRNGMAFYQMTGAGLMLQADIAGTKYWKNGKLNK
jgi:lipid-binding SYLF domain-containing protein